MSKERPILEVKDKKELKNTGTESRPFWARVGQTRWVRLFGILLFKHTSEGNFPDPLDKE
jgi:hypothetical protein